MITLENNKGFNCCELIEEHNTQLRIGLIDADLLDNGTRHPNLVLLKISGYCKEFGHYVHLIENYSDFTSDRIHIVRESYDLLVLSRVFKFTKMPPVVKEMILDGQIIYGGTGFLEEFEDDVSQLPNLPERVEHHMPDYHLYDEFIEHKVGEGKKSDWNDYINFSIGFTTRGCIRHCGFCVNRL